MKYLLLHVNCYLNTANRKQQNTDGCLSLDANWDIMQLIVTSFSRFCMKLTHLDPWVVLKPVMSGSFFCQHFFFVHIIITTIINQGYLNINQLTGRLLASDARLGTEGNHETWVVVALSIFSPLRTLSWKNTPICHLKYLTCYSWQFIVYI